MFNRQLLSSLRRNTQNVNDVELNEVITAEESKMSREVPTDSSTKDLMDLKRNKDYVFLNTAKQDRWSNMQKTFFKLPATLSWEVFILVLTLLNYLICTARYAFEMEYTVHFPIAYILMDLFYLVDVALIIMHRYWRSLQETMQSKKTPIVFIILDLISLFAQPLFIYYTAYGHYVRHLRLVTILRLHRMLIFIKMLKEAQMHRWIWLTSSYLVWNVILVHFCICGFHIWQCYLGECEGVPIKSLYTNAIFQVIQSIGGVGFGEHRVEIGTDIVVMVFLMIFGYFSTNVFLISLFSISYANKRLALFKYTTTVQAIRRYYTHEQMMSEELKEELRDYYIVLWVRKSGVTDAQYFSQLPTSLQMGLTYDVNCLHLRRSMLFADLPEPILRRVSLVMSHDFLLPGQIVFHQNVVKYGFISIATGVLEVLSDEDGQSPIIAFKRGTVLGEVSLFFSIPSKTTVRAASYTELQVLKRTDFINLMLRFPQAMTGLRERLMSRLQIAKSNKEETSRRKTHTGFNLLVSHGYTFRPIQCLKMYLQDEKISDEYVASQTKFVTEFLPLYRLAATITTVEQPPICLTYKLPWILEANSSFLRTWECIIVLSVLAVCLPVPYYAVIVRHTFPPVLLYLDTISAILYGINVYVQLTTAVVLKDRTLTKLWSIVQYKLRSPGIYIDVITLFPLGHFKTILISNKAKHFHLFSLVSVLRMWRFVYFVEKLEATVRHHIVVVKMCKWIIFMSLLLYYAGIIVYATACPMHRCYKDSWYIRNMKEAVAEHQPNPCYQYKLVMSIYYATMSLMLTGFGDIFPYSGTEKIIISILIICGILFVALCSVEFISTFLLNEEHRYTYRTDMLTLKKFLQKRNISNELIKRLENVLILQWNFDRGTGKKALLHTTPSHLKTAVQTVLLRDTIGSIPLFQNVDMDYLMMVVRNAMSRLLPPDEVICYRGDVAREIIIIQRGSCQALLDNGTYKTLGAGSQIGVLEMLCGVPKHYTALRMFPAQRSEVEFVLNAENFLQNVQEASSSRRQVTIARLVARADPFWKKILKASFINVLANSPEPKYTTYWKPFYKLGKVGVVGLFLLPICVRPDGPFLKIWNVMKCVLVIIMVMTLPMAVSMPPYLTNLEHILIASYVAGCIDVYINCLVGYYSKDTGVLISHPRYTAANYMKRSFVVDLVALVPLKFVVLWMATDHDEGHDPVTHLITSHERHCTWHVNLMLQTIRVFNAFGYMEKDIRRPARLFGFVRLLILLIIVLNLLTAFLFTNICTYKFRATPRERDESLIVYRGKNKTLHFGYLICNTVVSLEMMWYDHIENPFQVYTVLFYWVTSCLTQVGPGDITARSVVTMIYAVAVFCGVIIFSCLAGYWASTRSQHSSTFTTYREHYRHLLRFVAKEGLKTSLYNKLKRHFEHLWQRTGGVDPQNLLEPINTALAEDIMLGLYERALREVPLFNKMEQSFIRMIARRMTPMYLLQGDSVVKEHYIQYRIYIVLRGAVEVRKDDDDEVLAHMGIGGLFGNIRSGAPTVSTVTVVATKNLDLLFITSDKFYTILEEYPQLRRFIDSLLRSVEDYVMPSTIIDSEADSIRLMETNTSSQLSNISVASEDQATYESSALNFLIPWRWFKFALRPDHRVFQIARLTFLLCTYAHVIVTSYNFITHSASRSNLVVFTFLEIIYWFRIFLRFHEAYLDSYGIYVTKFPLIVEHYFQEKWTVARDVIPNLPLFTISQFLPISIAQTWLQILMLFQWLRIIYIWDFFKRAEQPLIANHATLRIFKIMLFYIFILHLTSCGWLAMACSENACFEGTWLDKYDRKMLKGPMLLNYCAAAYYVISLCTATGIGDIVPFKIGEVSYSIFLMIAGKCITAFLIGDIISIIYLSCSHLVNYEYKIKKLVDYLKNQNLSETQLQNIWKYSKILWSEEKGTQMPEMLKIAPNVMRCDIMYDLYGYHIKNCTLFQDLKEAIVRQACTSLKRVIFAAGNYIAQQGDADGNMYWVHKGIVSVLTVHANLTETRHDYLRAPAVFGLVTGLKHGWEHRFSFRAEATSYLLIMSIDDWDMILKLFPEDREMIYIRLSNLYMTL